MKLRESERLETLEYAAVIARSGMRSAPLAVSTLGLIARNAGCETRGPIEVSSGTWVHRTADGTTRLWHRPPEPAEVRALGARTTGASPPGRAFRAAAPARAVSVSPTAARVGRLLGAGR